MSSPLDSISAWAEEAWLRYAPTKIQEAANNFWNEMDKDGKYNVIMKVMGAAVLAGIVTAMYIGPQTAIFISLAVAIGTLYYLSSPNQPDPEFAQKIVDRINEIQDSKQQEEKPSSSNEV